MAWLERKGNVYQVSFRWGDRKFRRSLRTTDQTEAEEQVTRIRRRMRLMTQGDLDVPPETNLVSFLLQDGKPQTVVHLPAKALTLAELFQQYRDGLSPNSMEANSRYTIEIHLKHLELVLGAKFSIGKLNLADLQRYVDERAKKRGRRGQPLSPTTIKKEISSLSGVWNWASPRGIVSGPFPSKGLRYDKTSERPPFQTWTEIERQIARGGLTKSEEEELWDCLYLNVEQIERVLDHVKVVARCDFLHPMFVMAAHTGARRSELIRSQVADIDFTANVVHLREKKRVRGKRSMRMVPLSPLLRDVLAVWLEGVSGRYTFHIDDEPLTVHEATDHFKRTLAGSQWEKIRGWHVFRHSFISNCAAKGLDQRIIDAWSGHQTEEMRRRYTHLFPNLQQAAIRSVFER